MLKTRKRRLGPHLSCIIVSLTHLNGEEKFEFWGKLFLRIKAIREVDAPDAAVCMYLHAQSFNVVGAWKDCQVVAQFLHWNRSGLYPGPVPSEQRYRRTRNEEPASMKGENLGTSRVRVMLTISAASEIRKVELDLVPTLIKSHRHRADKRLHARCRLEMRNRESESVSRNHGLAFNANIRDVVMTRVKKMFIFSPPLAPDSWMHGSGDGRSCRPTPGTEE